jgi:transcriptional regulator with XRE-family HTH domain
MQDGGLGQRIKAARLARKLTMAQLAQACGLTKGFISQIESGASNPSLTTLGNVAKALGVAMSELLSGDPGPDLRGEGGAAVKRLRILHDGTGSAEQSGVSVLAVGPLGAHVLAMLPAGSKLVHAEEAGRIAPRSPAVATVSAGRISITQGDNIVELGRGGVAAWDAAAEYAIEATGPGSASLTIFVPEGCGLPEYVAAPSVEQAEMRARSLAGMRVLAGERASRAMPANLREHQAAFARASTDGPMRLVAMRAQRLAERKGQS